MQDRLISIHAPRVGSDGCWRSASRPRSDFNPRSPCGERPRSQVSPAQSPQNFNPRSPCGERLCAAAADFQLLLRISIHAPRVGSDRPNDLLHGLILVISIHAPRVGSDQAEVAERTRKINFNPRSPCGERRLAGSDGKLIVEFQSTLPVWGATPDRAGDGSEGRISIHAPRVGSDEMPTEQEPGDEISIHAPRVGSDFRSLCFSTHSV